MAQTLFSSVPSPRLNVKNDSGRPYPASRRSMSMLFWLLLFCPLAVVAEDSVSFATGGYARGQQSPEMKGKIDTNGDGMISREDWAAYQEQVFTRLDTRRKGSIPAWEFINSSGAPLETFATGGCERGFRTRELVRKIDVNHDHRISHDEFMAYQMQVFDMMDTSGEHKGFLSDQNFFDQIEANK